MYNYIEKENKLPRGKISVDGKKPRRKELNNEQLKEVVLGQWYQHQNNSYKNQEDDMKDEIRKQKWKELQEYIKTIDDEWTQKLKSLYDYIEKENKLPRSAISVDGRALTRKELNNEQLNEVVLGQWYQDQNYSYKNQEKKKGMKDEIRREKWKKFVVEFKEYLPSKYQLDIT